ncbi:MAG: VOC family protein [Bacteroidota bacterium]
MSENLIFHLAIPTRDIDEAREFYGKILKCKEYRSSDAWVAYNFFGHQLIIHRNPYYQGHRFANIVDGHSVPVPHFGVILEWDDWHKLAERLKNNNVKFMVEPQMRASAKGEDHGTMFFLDPTGNAIEIKAYKSKDQIF